MDDQSINITQQNIVRHAPPVICREHDVYDVETWCFTLTEPGVFDFDYLTAWCVECGGIRFVKPGDPVKLNLDSESLASLATNLRARNRPGHEQMIAAVTEMVA